MKAAFHVRPSPRLSDVDREEVIAKELCRRRLAVAHSSLKRVHATLRRARPCTAATGAIGHDDEEPTLQLDHGDPVLALASRALPRDHMLQHIPALSTREADTIFAEQLSI